MVNTTKEQGLHNEEVNGMWTGDRQYITRVMGPHYGGTKRFTRRLDVRYS
jgi:hypothetical protein